MTTHARPQTPRQTRPGATAAVPKLRYVVVVLAGIFAILGIQLLLSIAVSGGAYEIAGLKSEMRKSQQELQIVAEDISALTAPTTLAGLASAMGMVADNNPAYLRLSSGEVVGEAEPADSTSSLLLYPVTAGEEAPIRPAIVDEVLLNVSLAAATEAAELEALEEPEAEVVTPTPVSTTPAPSTLAPTVTPAAVTDAPKPRYGGSIPSPQTR